MTAKSTTELATELLDRFFRDAEGRTNYQIDVYFTLEDMGLAREHASPALQFLRSRDLVNLFGTDIAYLTDLGVRTIAEGLNIASLPAADGTFASAATEDKEAEAVDEPSGAAPPSSPAPAPDGRPSEAQIMHIDVSTGHEFTLAVGWRARIGRADGNEICIQDKRASKYHAEVTYNDGRYELADLDSANGTLVNGKYVIAPVVLTHEDEIVIGRTMLLFQAPAEVREPAPPRPPSGSEHPATLLPPTDLPGPSSTVPEDEADGRDAAPPPVFLSENAASVPEAGRPAPREFDAEQDALDAEDERPTRFVRGPSEDGPVPSIPRVVSVEPPGAPPAREHPDAMGRRVPDPGMSAPHPPPGDPRRREAEHEEPATVAVSRSVLGRPAESDGAYPRKLEDAPTVAYDRPTIAGHEPGRWVDAPRPSEAHPPFSPARAPALDRSGWSRAPRSDSGPLPRRASSPVDPRPPPEHTASPRARGPSVRRGEPSWVETLELLRRHVERADLPDRARLLEAIDVISDHPYVRVALNLIDR